MLLDILAPPITGGPETVNIYNAWVPFQLLFQLHLASLLALMDSSFPANMLNYKAQREEQVPSINPSCFQNIFVFAN